MYNNIKKYEILRDKSDKRFILFFFSTKLRHRRLQEMLRQIKEDLYKWTLFMGWKAKYY